MHNIQDNINQLSTILTTIEEHLHKMLAFEDQKYSIIKEIDFSALTEINEKQEVLVDRINFFEIQRQTIIDSLAQQLNIDPSLTLIQIIRHIPQEFQEDLKSKCFAIRSICDRINLATERNNYILQSHNEIFGQILGLVQDDVSRDHYNHFGQTQEQEKSRLYILDQIV